MTITPQEIRAAADERRRLWVKEHGLQVHTINLDRRFDRWARMAEIERDHPWIQCVRQKAIDLPSSPWIGCMIGHQLAVYFAKLRQDPFVLVAEDDFRPTNWFERLRTLIDVAAEREYDILYTGTISYADLIVTDDTSSIVQTDTILSSQLTCYFESSYSAFLSISFGGGSDWNRDPGVPAEHQERMATTYPKLKRGLTVPFLTTQISDYSDSCKRLVNMEVQWRDAENSWLSARRLGTNRVGS